MGMPPDSQTAGPVVLLWYLKKLPLTETTKISILEIPCSRGDSGALYLQSATAGVMFCLGRLVVMQPFISDVDVLVLRNGTS